MTTPEWHGLPNTPPQSGGADPFAYALHTFVHAPDRNGSTALYSALAASVRQARACGAPLDEVIASIKRVIAREMWPLSCDWTDRRGLAAQLVSWTVEAYYRAD